MDLTALAPRLGSTCDDSVEVTSVTHNSQWARPGSLYVALKGACHDGHSFIADAIARGAVAVMGEGLPEGISCRVPYLRVTQPRHALAVAAAALNGEPSKKLTVIGVTGTDGKTTTSLLTVALLRADGRRVGLLSTVGYQLPDGVLRQFPQHFTTPEAPQVQEILRQMVDDGADTVVLECSSHALVLERVGAVDFDVAVWTHLSREHLDFHTTMEGYFAAKRLLVERSQHAVLNADDPWTEQLHAIAPTEATYASRSPADWCASDVVEHDGGLSFTLTGPDGRHDVALPMVGTFNVDNATAALVAAHHVGVPVRTAVESLATFAGVPGRMQFVHGPANGPRVLVDFAHTPDSLEKALAALRSTTAGRLWCVIGAAGGPRDTGRIAPMGHNVAQYADEVVLTEDDSYDTPLDFLLDELERGAREVNGAVVHRVPDRREAITFAITQADHQDTVLLAGKGPEPELGRPGGPIPWDEVAEAHRALGQRA